MHHRFEGLGTAKSARDRLGAQCLGHPGQPAGQPAAHDAVPITHPQRPPLQGVLGPQQSESSLQPSLSSSTHCVADKGGGRCSWLWQARWGHDTTGSLRDECIAQPTAGSARSMSGGVDCMAHPAGIPRTVRQLPSVVASLSFFWHKLDLVQQSLALAQPD